MPTQRTKSHALAQLESERERLEEAIAALEPGRMLEGGVVGEWSVKDVLAHLADWEEHMLEWVDAARRGERVRGPEPGLNWRQLKQFNARVYERHRGERLDEMVEYFRTAHARFMEMVAAMPEEEMLAPGRYPFTGKQAIFDWLLQYAAHDAWGTRRIGEWQERRGTVAAS